MNQCLLLVALLCAGVTYADEPAAAAADNSAVADAAAAQAAAATQQLQDANKEIETLKASLATATKTAAANAEKGVADAEKTAAGAAEKLATLQTELSTLQASHAEQLTALQETSDQSKEKGDTLRKQLEKAEENANKYREQTSSLNTQVAELRAEKVALEASVTQAEERQAAAERAQVSGASEAEQSFATKLASAQEATAAAQGNLAAVIAEKEALASVLESADMQAYLQVRAATAHASEMAANGISDALEAASKETEIAANIAHNHYEDAWKESERMLNQAHPVVLDNYNEVVGQATPMVVQASNTVQEALATATAAVADGLKQVDPLKEHADFMAQCIVLGLSSLPVLFISLLFLHGFVTKLAMVLHKLQYAGVCAMLGAVLSCTALAFVTQKDPLAELRKADAQLDEFVHFVFAIVAVGFSVLHFVTLLTKKNGGKSLKACFASMVAAVLVVVVFAHYYLLVFSKNKATIQLPYSSEGMPSYAEYSTFFVALFVLTLFGAPTDFRFSLRSSFIALEAICAGATTVFALFASVQPDAFVALAGHENFQSVSLGLGSVLVLVLVVRLFQQFGNGVVAGLVAATHLAIVARLVLVFKRVVLGDKPSSMLKFAAAGFLFLTITHILCAKFQPEVKEPVSVAKDEKKKQQPAKNSKKGRK